MKTNCSIDLNNDELDALATAIDGKVTKRLATRADINELVAKAVGGLVEDARYTAGKVDPEPIPPESDLYRVHPGEERWLAGKSKSYIYGWNKARNPSIPASRLV